ncbi:MAG: RNA methyltransferase [Halobacteriovoraceae bacterium]|nr:RNA methyltransferase [Halobacteriovoraceae bacterium]
MTHKYLALIHYPITNKRGEVVTTSVTNMDIHDIARTCRTFGYKNYYIVTPIIKQQELISEILEYWNQDFANDYNPDRYDALSFIKVCPSLEEVLFDIERQEGHRPLVASTGANFKEELTSPRKLMEVAQSENRAILLIFGTGWGLHHSIVEQTDIRLDPILGKASDGYNHLSVRSAAAIYASQI